MVNLLQTKFMVPRVTVSHCQRQHLVDRVIRDINHKLAMIIAPAGYGKTTLMVDVTIELGQPVVWYQLDTADNDPATFLAYFVEGLRRTLPDVGQQIKNLLEGSEMLHASRAIIIILNELFENPGTTWTLVLDDYHVINNPAVHELTTTLIENRPPDMQIMLASRTAPPLPLPRWRVRGQLLDIRADTLRFSVDEAQKWLNSIIPDVADTTIETLIQKTEGWGAGLQLALTFLGDSKLQDHSALTENLEGTHPYIFNYLMEEVFERQPEELQTFLLKSSVLNQMNASDCNAVLDIEHAQLMLETLQKNNLFVFSLDSQRRWFRYHQLFHQFLRNKIRSQMPGTLEALHRLAGEYYAGAGEFEEAILHLLTIEDFPRAAEVFKVFGFAYIEQGRADILNHYLDQFPPEELGRHAELWLLYGKVLRHQGRITEAISKFERAVGVADNLDAVRCKILTLIELAGIVRSQGDYLRSQRLSDKAVQLSETAPSEMRALALMENAKSTGFLEGMGRGRQLAEEAIEETARAGSNLTQYQKAQLLRSLGQICWWHGDVAQAVRYGQDALSNVANPQSPLAAEIMLTLGTPLLYRHEYDKALTYAQKALDICQQLQLQELLPTAYSVLGNILTRVGELNRAETTLQKAIEHAEGMGAASYAQVMAGGYLAYNLVAQGRIDEAQTVAETALWPHIGEPTVYEIYVCRSVLADIYLENDEIAKARHVFEELVTIGEDHQYRIPLAMAYFGLAYIHLAENSYQLGLDYARKSLNLLAPSRAWELYVDQGQRAVLVCYQLAQILPDDPFLKKVLRELDASRLNGLFIKDLDINRIRIQTLGTFRVFRDTQEISEWSSAKARDMLAYFVTFRYENISIDRALYDLWPGEKKRGKAAFHTALYRVRQALRHGDEGIKYITVEAGDYRLDIARFDIDVEQFEHHVQAAGQANGEESFDEHKAALALYNGTYMDNLYFDWLTVERQRLEAQVIYILSTVYRGYANRRNYEAAILTARRLLTLNPLSEEVHCDIMRYLFELGDRKGVIEQYQNLSDVLMADMSIVPMPSTQELYQHLIQR